MGGEAPSHLEWGPCSALALESESWASLQGSPLLGHLVCGDLDHGLDPLQSLGFQLFFHLFRVTAETQASGRCLMGLQGGGR